VLWDTLPDLSQDRVLFLHLIVGIKSWEEKKEVSIRTRSFAAKSGQCHPTEPAGHAIPWSVSGHFPSPEGGEMSKVRRAV